jgi:transcriptional regulator with XRE-family HTH domain
MNTRLNDAVVEPARMTLGAFLRARRERLSPENAGIVRLSRRRTPGLRREEVAQLAHISPEWYTYLEQDRDVRPSPDVLGRIAEALQLSWAEREYLNVLAFPRSHQAALRSALPAGLQRFIDDLEYRPAYVVNDLWDIVGWNSAASALFPGLRADAQPNLVTSVFLNAEWRKLYVNWEANARKMLALFRLTVAAHAGDERCVRLVAELNAESPEFAGWWREQDVMVSTAGTKRLVHPLVGDFSLDYASFRTADDDSLTIIAFTPSDAEAKQKLKALKRWSRLK